MGIVMHGTRRFMGDDIPYAFSLLLYGEYETIRVFFIPRTKKVS